MPGLLKQFPLTLAALLAALAQPAVWAQAPNPAASPTPIAVPTEEQLAQFPRMTGFQLSPDGKHIVAIESREDARNILVWKADDLAGKPFVIGSSSMQIARVSFVKNDLLAVTLTQPYDARIDGTMTKTFITKLMITDLEGKVWKEPLASNEIARTDATRRLAALAVPTIKSRMPRDPDHIIVESDGLGSERDLFRFNVRTGAAARVLRLAENDLDVLVDGTGTPRVKTRTGNDDKGFYVATDVRNLASNTWEEHFRSHVKSRDVMEVVSVGSTPDTLVLRSNLGREVAALYEYNVRDRKVLGTLFEHKFFDASGVRLSGAADTNVAEGFDGFVYSGIYGTEVHWVNPKFDAVVKGMAPALGLKTIDQPLVDVVSGKRLDTKILDGAVISIVGHHNGPEPTYLLTVTGPAYPTQHYLLKGQKLTLLAREWPAVDRRALGSARFTYYQARDGLHIPAIVTVPNPQLCGPGPYAAVVHPHGGPWSRDNMTYDNSGWVPLMVSRCQVVLQPQFRGSAGWGRALWLAGDAEWGQKMQDDKDDGAKWLVSEKLADPKRIAIFGFSYGGYAAFAAAIRPNGLYKCAISGAGVSDIDRIWADFYTNPFFRDRQAPTVKGLSPRLSADQIKIPIMVYHGDRDRTVPIIQSEWFVEMAKKSNQKVDFHELTDYAHGPAWTRATATKHLKLISSYLASGCGGSGL